MNLGEPQGRKLVFGRTFGGERFEVAWTVRKDTTRDCLLALLNEFDEGQHGAVLVVQDDNLVVPSGMHGVFVAPCRVRHAGATRGGFAHFWVSDAPTSEARERDALAHRIADRILGGRTL